MEIKQDPAALLTVLRRLQPETEPLFLVGGAIRDRLLGRQVHDLDFTGPGAMRTVALETGRELSLPVFPLDPERGTWRVVDQAARLTFDFTPFRGRTLEDDLRSRDLTINAIAEAVHAPGELIDPLGGAQDLKAGCLRACSGESMRADPLRVLRAIRLSLELDFTIASDTQTQMQQAGIDLLNVSAERIRDEWCQLFEKDLGSRGMLLWQQYGITDLFPDLVAAASPGDWEARVALLAGIESLSREARLAEGSERGGEAMPLHWEALRQPMNEYLARILVPPVSHKVAMGFAALSFVSSGCFTEATLGFAVSQAMKRSMWLAMGSQTTKTIRLLLEAQPSLAEMVEEGPALRNRSIYRYFRQFGEAGVGAAMLFFLYASLPGRVLLSAPVVIKRVLEAWFMRQNEIVSPPLLLDGEGIMRALKIQPGAQVGRLLEQLHEAQADGEVWNTAQAIEYIDRIYTGRERNT